MPLRVEIIRETLDLIKHVDLKMRKKGDLSPLQLRALEYILNKNCVKSTDLAKEFNVTPATITAQIDKLVNNGWLERCNDSVDRRVINITSTDKLKKELYPLIDKTVKRYDWVFEVLTEEEQNQLLSLITKIHKNANKVATQMKGK